MKLKSKQKGCFGETAILKDLYGRGYQVAIPFGENCQFDLIVIRKNKPEKLQCKYTESDGKVIRVRCQSTNNWSTIKYTKNLTDWLVVYDKTTDSCYYISSKYFLNGRSQLNLRIQKPNNKQKKHILWAENFKGF
jgi:hypothetical protein